MIPSITFLWLLLLATPKKHIVETALYSWTAIAFFFLTPEIKNNVFPDLQWKQQVADCRGTFQLCELHHHPILNPPTWNVKVQLDEHRFEPPQVKQPASINFGNQIELVGYELKQSRRRLNVELVFTKAAEIETSYKYFVHIVRNDNETALAYQVDNIPQYWHYPTNVWLDGEYLVETIEVPLDEFPIGSYHLRVGWYDPAAEGAPRLKVVNADGYRIVDNAAIISDQIVRR